MPWLPLMLLASGTTVPPAQGSDPRLLPRHSFEERPFSLDAELEQKYSLTKANLQNPVKLRLTYRTPSDFYRVGLGYSFTPQTAEHTVSVGVRFHLLSFGRRR